MQLSLIGGLLVAGGSVLADTPSSQPASSAAPDANEPTPPAPNPDDVEIPSMSKKANISPHDMVDRTSSDLDAMRKDLSHIVQLQESARKKKDVIKLNCVNDKLLQVKQLLNIGETASTDLQEAIARNDEDGRYHQFSRITIADQQVTVLTTEAENCIGEDLTFLGPTTIDVTEPEQPDDPTASPQPDFPVVDLPPLASPFV